MQGTFRFSFGPEVRHTIPFNGKLEQYRKLGFDGVPDMAKLTPAQIVKEVSDLKKVLDDPGLTPEFVRRIDLAPSGVRFDAAF